MFFANKTNTMTTNNNIVIYWKSVAFISAKETDCAPQ